MAITFIRKKEIEEYDVEQEQRRYRQFAARRSAEITKVMWGGTPGNPASQVVDEYAARVRADGGIVEALDCLQAKIYSLMV